MHATSTGPDVFPSWSNDYATIIQHIQHHVESKLGVEAITEAQSTELDDNASESTNTSASHSSDSSTSSSSSSSIEMYTSNPNKSEPPLVEARNQEETTSQQSQYETSNVDDTNLGENTSQTTQSKTSNVDVQPNDRLENKKVE